MFDFLGLRKEASKTKILVVDDEPNIVQTLQDRLEMNEYEVVTAGNGREGLQKFEQERPDVILLDVIMPIMDGHEMLEMLRKQPGGQDVSVIMLTARSQTQDIARANACGIDDYIVKPFDLSELLEKIESVVEHRKTVMK
ncbi:MAG TPA: response regulator [Anaerohalosphaeraceae bacterium]|jgi:DNA-binding response OmpR family regulator|nr:response regulator [Anaerohalosphaeraceae bacterium]HRT49111.1 response regulator [Anaerohalosphaeraceae bacterium]HRT85636.1 response regulator [Anaerohalosphaeraceae bacterium]